MYNNMKKNLLLYAFTALFFIPIFLLNRDLWDGVIISHAFETKNPEIYWNWFTESGWFLTPYFYDVFYYIFNHDNFLQYFYLFFLVCHITSTHQIYKLSRKTFNFDECSSLVASAVFALSPLWNIYFSTVFLMHAFTLALALYCTNRILEYKLNSFIVFSALSLITFQQASIPPVIISILLLDLIIKKDYKNSYYVFCYILLSVVFFLYTRQAFPAHGLYENYNSMKLDNIFVLGHYDVFLKYIIDVYPLFIPLLFLSLLLSKCKIKVILFSGLIFTAIIPFILVGKPAWPSHLYVIEGWDQRQAITLTIAVALIFGLMHAIFFESRYRKFLILTIYISIVMLSIKLYSSIEIKIKSILIQNAIVSELKKNKTIIGDCGIVLTVSTSPSFRNFSSYELNYLAWEAFNKRKYIHSSTRRPNDLNIKEIYKDKYILPNTYPACMKSVTLHTNIDNLNLYQMFSGRYLNQYFEIKAS